MPPSGTVIFSSGRKALFKCSAYVVIEYNAWGVFFLRVNVELSLKINSSILFHPLQVVGGMEKGGEDQRPSKKKKKETK